MAARITSRNTLRHTLVPLRPNRPQTEGPKHGPSSRDRSRWPGLLKDRGLLVRCGAWFNGRRDLTLMPLPHRLLHRAQALGPPGRRRRPARSGYSSRPTDREVAAVAFPFPREPRRLPSVNASTTVALLHATLAATSSWYYRAPYTFGRDMPTLCVFLTK
jgi:hypothetical protein